MLMYYMRPFTVLSGCLRHFHLFVCLFWRKRLYCAAPSYGRCGSQEETSFLCIIHWLGSSVPVHNCTHSEDEGDVSGCDGDFLLGGTPLTTVNGVSQFQPEWICWEPGGVGSSATRWRYYRYVVFPILSVCHDVWRICSGIFFLVCR